MEKTLHFGLYSFATLYKPFWETAQWFFNMYKRIAPYLSGIWFSLPIQLVLLHFRKFQALLILWYVLFAVVNGSFLFKMGAHILYLYPEYLGKVGFISTMLVGISIGIFIFSWNITTFILHTPNVEFLATTTQPFLKYCFNNAIIPLCFLFFYLEKAIVFGRTQELLDWGTIFWLMGGFITGLSLCLFVGFSWFFGADHTIYRYASPGAKQVIEDMKKKVGNYRVPQKLGKIRVDWYLTPSFKRRQPRDTRHYPSDFLQRIFTQHHYSAMLAILLAFISLIISGYFIDNKFFQVPAAGSITVLFAILIAVAGAVSYFLKQWTIPIVLLCFLGLNFLFQKNILDPRNKAYGLSYDKAKTLPQYSREGLLQICNPDSIKQDSLAFINRLNAWKKWQGQEKPVLLLNCLSGGGIRSAIFTAEVWHSIDSITNRRAFSHTFLMSGASGGMMGAAWYRELSYRLKNQQLLPDELSSKLNKISTDLLNPVFSSFAVRDLLSPPRRFLYSGAKYIKDRGYAFERQFSLNTEGWLDKPLGSYRAAEDSAVVPTLFVNSVVTADGRNLMMTTRGVRFMMRPLLTASTGPLTDADAICFQSFFANRKPNNLRFLTALRMSATFPYVLPNVWLPTEPVVDVMDAGFRDNTGVETSLKFMHFFKDWIRLNCSKVVLVEIRDKPQGGWNAEPGKKNIIDLVTRPAVLTQTTLFRFQEYSQLRQIERMQETFGNQFERVVFEYIPKKAGQPASLSFHITEREKRDIISSLKHPQNKASMARIERLLHKD